MYFPTKNPTNIFHCKKASKNAEFQLYAIPLYILESNPYTVKTIKRTTILLSHRYNFPFKNSIIIYIAIKSVKTSSQYPIIGLLKFNSNAKLKGNSIIAIINNVCLFFLIFIIQRCTLPFPPFFIKFSTSDTVTLLKSPSIECFRQLAATANSIASLSFLPVIKL